MAGYTAPSPYQDVTGATIDAFNPANAGNFLNNFNDASVLYSSSEPNTEEQANNLIAAYQYLSDPANQATEDAENGQGWSQNMLGQLQNDISEQQNLVQLNQGNNTQQTASTNYSQAQQIIQQIQNNPKGDPANIVTLAQQLVPLGVISQDQVNDLSKEFQMLAKTPGSTGTLDTTALTNNLSPLINTGLQKLQQNLTNSGTALNPLENNVIQNFTLNSPDYAAAQSQLQNYYGIDANGNPIAGDTTGQVQQLQNTANSDIYQQAYQLKQAINNQASQVGASSSGQRTRALGNVSSQAAENSANAYEQDAQNAQQAIDAYNTQVQQQQAAQQNEVNSVKSGAIGDLFGSTTQANIGAYNQNANAANQTNETQAQNQLTQDQQNSSLWNGILKGVGTGIGAIGGTLLAGPAGGAAGASAGSQI